MSELTHVDKFGRARMVDVSEKSTTARLAIAEGQIAMAPETLEKILSGDAPKGDVIGTARLAGIMAAKRTSELIPLCHGLPLTAVDIEIEPSQSFSGLNVRAVVRTSAQTGVEMEALTSVSVACLTLYDMAKALDRGMIIGGIRLIKKAGGQHGDYVAPGA